MSESSIGQTRSEGNGALLKGVVVIVLLGVAAGLLYNHLGLNSRRAWGLSWIAVDQQEEFEKLPTVTAEPAGSAGSTFVSDDPLAGVPMGGGESLPQIPDVGRPVPIDLAGLKQFFDADGAVIVDAREPHEFAQSHIAGAINMPFDEVVTDPVRLESLQTAGRPIITYCGGGSCEVSRSLAEAFYFDAGHPQVAVYIGGFPEWTAAGYPVSSGSAEKRTMEALKRLLTHPVVIRLCQLGIGAIFVWAGLAKIGDLRTFSEQIHNFRMLPIPLENLVAMTLPWVEVVAGFALIVGLRARAAALIASALMAVFIVAVGAAVARGLDVECGCFGTSDASTAGWTKLLENLGMLAMALIAGLKPN